MSIQAISWAMEYQDLPVDGRTGRLSSSAKLVLIALANHADRDGSNCFPSIDTICWYTGMSERAVQYTLRQLEEHGTIWKTPNPLVRAAKIDDPRKRPQSYDIVPLGAAEQEGKPTAAPKRSRGAKSTQSRGANSAKTLHPNRPGTVLNPEPSKKSSSSQAMTDSSANLEDRHEDRSDPDPKLRGYPAAWDEQDAAEDAHDARVARDMARLEDEPGIDYFEPGEEAMSWDMLMRGEPYAKVLALIRKQRRLAA